MVEGKVGDRLVLESRKTGQGPREGEILEVLGAGEGVHYRVRWADGHESIFFLSGGSVTIIRKAKKARVPYDTRARCLPQLPASACDSCLLSRASFFWAPAY